MNNFELKGKKCTLIQGSTSAPVFLLALGSEEADTPEDVYRRVLELRPGADFSLFAFECEDWDSDYSPWEAHAFRYFAGNGSTVLEWLKNSALPYCRSLSAADVPGAPDAWCQGVSDVRYPDAVGVRYPGSDDPLTELSLEGISDPAFTDVPEPVQTAAYPKIMDDFESGFFEARDAYPGGSMDPGLGLDTVSGLTFLPDMMRTAYAEDAVHCGIYGKPGATTGMDLKPRVSDDATPDAARCYVLGYSLAGLFSLWALSENCGADGAACVSGSLWFPGWDDYSKTAVYPAGSRIYLSLGGKESNSPDPLVATIGRAYDLQYSALRKAGLRCVYEKNSGGHFASPHHRLAKAIAWLLG